MAYHRITIAGNSGSGKSTLSEEVGLKLRLPVKHIDRILWRPNWKFSPEEEFVPLHEAWLAEPSWLIEGVGYMEPLKRCFALADLIVFLDTPRELCIERAKERMAADAITPNRFIAENCPYEAVREKQWQIIDYFDEHLRPALLKLLSHEFRDKPQLILDGRLSLEQLLAEF